MLALFFFRMSSIFTINMKKALFISGALAVMIAVLQSCAPNRHMPRPQRHPTPPKKFVMQQTPVQHVDVVLGNS